MDIIQFDIDGYIGAGAYSKQMVRTLMRDAAEKEVVVNLSSLGGDIDHGLNIPMLHKLIVNVEAVVNSPVNRTSAGGASLRSTETALCRPIRIRLVGERPRIHSIPLMCAPCRLVSWRIPRWCVRQQPPARQFSPSSMNPFDSLRCPGERSFSLTTSARR